MSDLIFSLLRPTVWIMLLGCCLSFICPADLLAQQVKKNMDTPPSELTDKLNTLMEAYTKAGLFNGSVLIQQRGQVLLNKGYGIGDYAAHKLNHADSRYQVYSITKPVTAVMILMLAEQAKLRLNDKLSMFYPSVPASDSITIEHLLTHTSGLYPYNNDGSMPTKSEADMIEFLSKRRPEFTPGTSWRYCNTGYYLLGFIISKLTGMSYEKSLAKYIFNPLEMRQTGFGFDTMKHPLKATGYTFVFPDTAKTAQLFPSHELFAAGGIWSTTDDLLKFNTAMQDHGLNSSAMTEHAYTVFRSGYGYGWFTDSVNGHRVISHSGGAPGFRSYLVRIEDPNTCIIVLSNSELTDVTVVKNSLLKILFNEPYPIPQPVNVSHSSLALVSGVYRFDAERSVYITRLGSRLAARVSGQTQSILVAESDSVFYTDTKDAKLSFRQNSAGQPDTLLLARRNKVYKGYRISATWGITGSVVPGGWDTTDTPLRQVEENVSLWRSMPAKLSPGIFKFRYNNDWTFNYGLDRRLQPGRLSEGGADIPVIKEGIYIIELDLANPDKPVHRMILQ